MLTLIRRTASLNEVQFPKELQPLGEERGDREGLRASMKCSSQRNCNTYLNRADDLGWAPQ